MFNVKIVKYDMKSALLQFMWSRISQYDFQNFSNIKKYWDLNFCFRNWILSKCKKNCWHIWNIFENFIIQRCYAWVSRSYCTCDLEVTSIRVRGYYYPLRVLSVRATSCYARVQNCRYAWGEWNFNHQLGLFLMHFWKKKCFLCIFFWRSDRTAGDIYIAIVD